MSEDTVIDQQIVITIAVDSRWTGIWNPRLTAVITSVDVNRRLVTFDRVTQYGERWGKPTRARVAYFLSEFHPEDEVPV